MDFWDPDDTLEDRAERFLRSQAVLVASAVLAVASMFLVPPSWGYADYIDVRTLCILFCFMAVVAGLKKCNVFKILAQRILGGSRSVTVLCLLLVLLPFFCAMFITNDVALLTFVPFAILVLRMAKRSDLIVPVVVLQTVAAILGSMSIPFGNAQNLYISSNYDVGMAEFFSVMLPLTLVGLVVVVALSLRFGRDRVSIEFEKTYALKHRKLLAVSVVLFALCVATVLRWVPYQATIVLTVASILLVRPKTMLKVDYGLLLTMAFMFVFAGNMAQIDAVRQVFGNLMSWDPTVTAMALSQVTSNMPASVLLDPDSVHGEHRVTEDLHEGGEGRSRKVPQALHRRERPDAAGAGADRHRDGLTAFRGMIVARRMSLEMGRVKTRPGRSHRTDLDRSFSTRCGGSSRA